MRRILVLILTAMAVISLLAACGSSSSPTPTATQTEATATAAPTKTATPTSTATETETATATPTATATVDDKGGSSGGSDDVSELAAKTAKAFGDVKSVHFEMTMETQVGDEAGAVTASGDMQPPDRSHMKMDVMGMQLEVITIGTDSYTKLGEEWTKTSDPTTGTTDPSDIINDMDLPKTGKKLADENVDGTECSHIQYRAIDMEDSATGAEFGDAVMDVYIAKDTSLLKKMVIVSQGTGEDMPGSTITMTFSKYNEPLNIEAPI